VGCCVADQPFRPLPDFALTAYCVGGDSAVAPLVIEGLVPIGDYCCPRCEGAGRMNRIALDGSNRLMEVNCGECLGMGEVAATPDGFHMAGTPWPLPGRA
jgi:hypothetical protein